MNPFAWLSFRKDRQHRQKLKPIRIVADADGLRTLREEHEGQAEVLRSLQWSDVSLVAAYRKDCFGFDLLCVELLPVDRAALVMQEGDEGFSDACFAITEHLSVEDENWFLKLMARDAFDTTIAIVYKRPPADDASTTPASS